MVRYCWVLLLHQNQPVIYWSSLAFAVGWREYRRGGLDGKTGTEGGLALVLLSRDRVPCLTGAVAMGDYCVEMLIVTLIVIPLLLLIVTKPGQYPALYSCCFSCLPLLFTLSLLHMISSLCVPPCLSVLLGSLCVRSMTAICCTMSNTTACWQHAPFYSVK